MRSFIRSHVGESDGGLYCIVIDGFASSIPSRSVANGSTPFRRLKRVRFPVLGPPRTNPSILLMGFACWGGLLRGIFCGCCCGMLRMGSPGIGLGRIGGSTATGRACASVGTTASSYSIDSVAPIFTRVLLRVEYEFRPAKKLRCNDKMGIL